MHAALHTIAEVCSGVRACLSMHSAAAPLSSSVSAAVSLWRFERPVQRRFSILFARTYAQHSVALQTNRVALDSGKHSTFHVVSVLAPAETNN